MAAETQTARLLIVDDNAALADNLKEILDEQGYRVEVAGTCAAAVKAAGAHPFDVALVDLRLPDGEGTTRAPRLKELVPDGEVVLLTGFATVETAAEAVRAGAFAYLVKPCAIPELSLTLEQALRQVRLHREKRELQRRALVAEKLAAVGTMTAGLSHEIRNPLNSAGLQLTVLERGIQKLPTELQPKLLEPLKLVQDEIRRLDHILEDFLNFARPREVARKPVDMQELVAKALDFLEPQAREQGLRFERSLESVPAIGGDANRLREVVVNLILNAMEAMDKRGAIVVELRPRGEDVLVAIEDAGPGIPAEIRPRIFEPFFTTKAKGTGLGLPIVHAIVVQHGGSISILDSVSGGARFEVVLPRL